VRIRVERVAKTKIASLCEVWAPNQFCHLPPPFSHPLRLQPAVRVNSNILVSLTISDSPTPPRIFISRRKVFRIARTYTLISPLVRPLHPLPCLVTSRVPAIGSSMIPFWLFIHFWPFPSILPQPLPYLLSRPCRLSYNYQHVTFIILSNTDLEYETGVLEPRSTSEGERITRTNWVDYSPMAG